MQRGKSDQAVLGETMKSRVDAQGFRMRAALLLLAIIGFPQCCAAEDAAAEKERRQLELSVVGPDGAAVPGATLELRCNPKEAAEAMVDGKPVGVGFAKSVKADDQGKLTVRFAKPPEYFVVDIEQPGFGPYFARWSTAEHADPIPERFTAQLDAGWSVGGIVVDDKGEPIVGVEVNPRVKFKKRPGDLQDVVGGSSIKTDAAGRWRYDCAPQSLAEFEVEINHPQFEPLSRTLTRGDFEIKGSDQPTGKIVLPPGLTVAGKVTDEEGQPIADARLRIKFLNSVRETKTDAAGAYQLKGCEPGTHHIIASAKGRAIDMQQVQITADMEPVDFLLQPGG
jgi:hypothetical protein